MPVTHPPYQQPQQPPQPQQPQQPPYQQPQAQYQQPQYQQPVLAPSLAPTPLPPGYGYLLVEVSRGPYIVPAHNAGKVKIEGLSTGMKLGPGRWHIPVVAGWHTVKLTDLLGMPMVSTQPQLVQPGAATYVYFHVGAWRNRAKDAQGTDVTKFGMWSNYSFLLILLGVVLLACCALPAAFGAFSS